MLFQRKINGKKFVPCKKSYKRKEQNFFKNKKLSQINICFISLNTKKSFKLKIIIQITRDFRDIGLHCLRDIMDEYEKICRENKTGNFPF